MKLILREYLSSLRERDELDAIVPDLLGQVGLSVFSRPRRGVREDGVDVAAVGQMEGDDESVYLVTIKSGDLTRSVWSSGAQAVRQSLEDILDLYIPNRIPEEHVGKPVIVAVCLGGEVSKTVDGAIKSYTRREGKKHGVEFRVWHGDFLAGQIERHFLHENLLGLSARRNFRKALAMLDEPVASYEYFVAALNDLVPTEKTKPADRLTAARQLALCAWIVFAWARSVGNLEAAYRIAERALFCSWDLCRPKGRKSAFCERLQEAFGSLYECYWRVSREYLEAVALPSVGKRHALSSAVRGGCALDVSLKMFDLLGRLSVQVLWLQWQGQRLVSEDEGAAKVCFEEAHLLRRALADMVSNNPILLHPMKDDQVVEVCAAIGALLSDAQYSQFCVQWLNEMVVRCDVALAMRSMYPSTHSSYSALLSSWRGADQATFEAATRGSTLFPMLGLWAAILGQEKSFRLLQKIASEHLPHCTMQVWFPDEETEAFLRTGEPNGVTMTGLNFDRSIDAVAEEIFAECDASDGFESLTFVKAGWWPLAVVACRHYRVPLPPQVFRGFWRKRDTA